MADNNNLGDLSVNITGDVSELDASLQQAQEAAAAAGAQIGKALEDGSAAATTGLENLRTKLFEIAEALVITEGLREFGAQALEAADDITKTSIALTTLTGDAEKAEVVISGLENLGIKDGLSMPGLLQAGTRMQAILGPGADVANVLGKIADGAAVMGTDIGAAANAFDRMVESGKAGAKQLMALGINMEDLAKAINTVNQSNDVTSRNAAAAFKALDDEATRAQVLETALDKLGGTAQKVADQTFGGQWQELSNQWLKIMDEVGKALLPVITDLTNFAKTDVLPTIKGLADGFAALSPGVKDAAVAVGLLAASAIPLVGLLGGVVLAMNGLRALPGAVAEGMEALAGAFGLVGTEAKVAAADVVEAEREMAAARATAVEATGATAGLEEGIVGIGAAAGGLVPVLIGAAAVIAGLVAAEAISRIRELNKSLDDLRTASDNGVHATAEQAQQIAVLTNALQKYNDQAQFTNQHPVTIPKFDPTLPDPVEAFVKALEEANQKLPAFAKGMTDSASAIKAFKESGLIDISGMLSNIGGETAKLSPQLQHLVTVHNDLNEALRVAKTTMDQARQAFANHQVGIEVLRDATNKYDEAVKAASGDAKAWGESVAGISASIQKAQETFKSSVAVFEQIAINSDGSAKSIAMLAEAYAKAQAAAKAAHEDFDNLKMDEINLTIEANKAQEEFTRSVQIFNDLATASDGSARDLERVAQAYAHAEAAAKTAHQTFSSIPQIMEQMRESVDKQLQTLNDNAAAWANFAKAGVQTIQDQQALANALKSITSEATALGLKVQQVGDALIFSVADPSSKAAIAQQNLADKLNAVTGGTVQFVQGLDGKLIPLLKDSANSAELFGVGFTKSSAALSAASAASGQLNAALKQGQSAIEDHAAAMANAANKEWDFKAAQEANYTDTTQMTNAIGGNATALADQIQKLWDAQQAALKAGNAFVNAAGGITLMGNAAPGAVTGLNNITSAAQSATKAVNDLTAAEQAFDSGASSAFGGAGNTFKSKGSPFQMTKEEIAAWWDQMGTSPFGSRAPGFGGNQWGPNGNSTTTGFMGFIPMFADGGYAASKTLAIVAENGPELIIPMSQVNQSATQMGSAMTTFIDPFLRSLNAISSLAITPDIGRPGMAYTNPQGGAVHAGPDLVPVIQSMGQSIQNAGPLFTNAINDLVPVVKSTGQSIMNLGSMLAAPGSKWEIGAPYVPPPLLGGTQGSLGSLQGGSFQANPGPISMPITVQGNYVSSQQMVNDLVDKIQTTMVAKLRQAGLKL